MAVTYKTLKPQEVADILIHSEVYGINILNMGINAGFYTVRLQQNFIAQEYTALNLVEE